MSLLCDDDKPSLKDRMVKDIFNRSLHYATKVYKTNRYQTLIYFRQFYIFRMPLTLLNTSTCIFMKNNEIELNPYCIRST